ncbi:MAG: hypothetical protein H6619_02935 [Deltaproteobacteria bacterium]|nr:hypothetical protein [Deltaproteobacteria bacterium]
MKKVLVLGFILQGLLTLSVYAQSSVQPGVSATQVAGPFGSATAVPRPAPCSPEWLNYIMRYLSYQYASLTFSQNPNQQVLDNTIQQVKDFMAEMYTCTGPAAPMVVSDDDGGAESALRSPNTMQVSLEADTSSSTKRTADSLSDRASKTLDRSDSLNTIINPNDGESTTDPDGNGDSGSNRPTVSTMSQYKAIFEMMLYNLERLQKPVAGQDDADGRVRIDDSAEIHVISQ